MQAVDSPLPSHPPEEDSSEQLLFVVNAVPALIAYVDSQARYVWANESYHRWFGYAAEQLRGRHARDVLGASAWERIKPYVERVLSGEEVTFEDELVYKSGPPRTVRAAYVPHRDSSGKVCGFVGMVNDITEMRATELALRRALTDLRDADRRKDQFLAMLSHELRNPLAPILYAVEILNRAGPDKEELAAEYRSVIARQVQHMGRLLDDLLDVSRVRQGKIQLRKQPVELGALLRQAIEVSHPMITEKQQHLSVTLAPELPPIDADPTRLVQVFANLVNNAAKYTDRGGHISVDLQVHSGDAVVRVRDDGVGMSPELLAGAFDLFVQETGSLDRTQGGLGIGLTMVRTLVKMHGGSVRALSEGPGRGSELVVRLPVAAGQTMPLSRAHASTIEAKGSSLRVLVVDDNEDAADMLGDLLEQKGHEVTLAYDGPGALAAADTVRPELVIVDLGLPGMDGYAVAVRLRDDGHDRATLVALTGYGGDEDRHRSSAAGFDHHLVKPIDFAVLEQIAAQRVMRPVKE
jgi:PAS domain S-box-containing protein